MKLLSRFSPPHSPPEAEPARPVIPRRRLVQRRVAARHAILATAVLLLIALALFSVLGLNEPRLIIAIRQGIEGAALKKVAERFSRDSRSRVSVEVVEWPYDQLFEEERRDLCSASPRYDIVMMDDPWLPALLMADNNEAGFSRTTRRLRKLFDHDSDFPDDFVKSTRDVCQYKDGFYALPFVGNSQLFCYRPSDFTDEKVPVYWRDVLTQSQRIMKKDPSRFGYVMRVGQGNSIVTDFLPILWEEYPDALTSNGTQLQPPAEKALELLMQLGAREDDAEAVSGQPRRLAPSAPGPGDSREDLSIVAADDFDLAVQLTQGKAAMSIIWSAWAMAMARLPSPGPGGVQKSIWYTDHVPGGKPAVGAWLLAVSDKSRNQAAANEFLLYATSPAQITRAAREGNPPPLRSVLTDEKLQDEFPSFPFQLKSLEASQPRRRTPFWREIERTLGASLSDLYAGAISPKEAIDQVNKALKVIEEKERKLDSSP